MIIKLSHPETNDECLLEIFDSRSHDVPIEIMKFIINDYEEHYIYSSSINGLMEHLKEKGYIVRKINPQHIEFGHY